MNIICNKCHQEKDSAEFYFQSKRNYFNPKCKKCMSTKKIFHIFEEKGQLVKKCTKCKENKTLNSFSQRVKTGYYKSECKICSRERAKEHRLNNPEHYRQKEIKRNLCSERQKWKKEYNKIYSLKYARYKRQTDISYKIKMNISRRIRNALRGIGKIDRTIKLLGCSIDFFKQYLVSKFLVGMSWDNYGLYGWHIDHIIPCASFDLEKESEQYKCFHYTNLQPLWAKDNLQKSNKILPLKEAHISIA